MNHLEKRTDSRHRAKFYSSIDNSGWCKQQQVLEHELGESLGATLKQKEPQDCGSVFYATYHQLDVTFSHCVAVML